jgi:hypothetical protein
MEQKEQILQFNHQLERLLSGKALDTFLTPSDERTLELARRLSLANYSAESCIRDALYLRLIKSSAIGTKPIKMRLPRFNFSTWAWTAFMLMVLLVHSIEISSPQPAFIATNQPAHVFIKISPRRATTPSWMAGAQAFKPVPIPTPLAISAINHAHDQPFLVPNLGDQSSWIGPDQTKTPKPDPQPHSVSRP